VNLTRLPSASVLTHSSSNIAVPSKRGYQGTPNRWHDPL
jgi:hypothetical protein